MSVFARNAALRSLFDQHGPALAAAEGLSLAAAREAVEAGTLVLLGNPAHTGLNPLFVGQPSRVKVNANIGTSPFQNHPACEQRKLQIRGKEPGEQMTPPSRNEIAEEPAPVLN